MGRALAPPPRYEISAPFLDGQGIYRLDRQTGQLDALTGQGKVVGTSRP